MDTEASPKAPPSRRRKLLIGAGITLLLAWMTFASLFTVFRVEGESMSPTLSPGEQVVAYRYGSWAPGDVIVFKNPHDPRELLIKRVHAVAGETVALHGGTLRVDGAVRKLPTAFFDELPPRVIQPGHVFVLGDNHASSLDSRRLGAVAENLVVGKAVFRLWPFGAIQ